MIKLIKHVDDDVRQRLVEHLGKLRNEVEDGEVAALLTVVFKKDGSSYHIGTCTNRDQQISGLFQMAVNTTMME